MGSQQNVPLEVFEWALLILMCISQVSHCILKLNKVCRSDQSLGCYVAQTYIALNLIGVPRVLKAQGIRQVCIVMQWLLVVDVGGHVLGHPRGSDANHVPRGVVTGFGVLIVFLVFSV